MSATEAREDWVWPPGEFVVAVALAALVVAALASVSHRGWSTIGIGVAIVAAVAFVTYEYETQMDDRFGRTRGISPVHEWAFTTSDLRIAVTGLPLTYSLHGGDLSNEVEYLGDVGPDGEFLAIVDCRRYRTKINAGDFTHVILWPAALVGGGPPPETEWIEGAAELVVATGNGAAFRLLGDLDPDDCG